MNPSKSFPIEQSYINLAIVETKAQQAKEKQLLNTEYSNDVIGTYEEIYGAKTKIEIKDIFERCTEQTKKILVLGRVGIGKTTFCRYAAHQWARGAIWQQYELVVFIRLRGLTESRYPPLPSGTNYSLLDLVKKEYFHHGLSEKDEKILREQFDNGQILWLLDGYDEIAQNVPEHLKYLFEQLLKTPHHILTSRPYLNTLSYNAQLEITGFTDDSIKEYVEQFFNQAKDEMDNALLHAQKLLDFLKHKPRIWGIVHIPVNLELISSLWCDTDWSETITMTMTTVYDKMIEWLCRRHLERQNICPIQTMTKETIYAHCHKELAFLESLAFNGMVRNSIILRPELLRIASMESNCCLHDQPHLLNIGILKSLDYKPIGTRIEPDKSHYFIHLSFQEHFAARYLVKALNNDAEQQNKAIDFIKDHKYNQRFELVFNFASGLLSDTNVQHSINLFWDTLSGEPLDLIGLRHVQIVISCLEEASCNSSLPQYRESINSIIKWITYFIFEKYDYSYNPLLDSLQRSPLLVNQEEILDTFKKLYKDKNPDIKESACRFFSDLPISNLHIDLTGLHLAALNDEDPGVRQTACLALRKMREKAATDETINRLLNELGNKDDHVRMAACKTLFSMGEKAVTNEVINALVTALEDRCYAVRSCACESLGKMGEKAATNEVINGLANALGDTYAEVKLKAYFALGSMGKKAATNEVINRLMNALEDTDSNVRLSACEALGSMGEKAATNELITGLANALGDKTCYVRESACKALGKIGEKAVTNEVINEIVNALEDTDSNVRLSACEALGSMGEKAATNEVITGLVNALGDKTCYVRESACKALGKMGEKAVTNEVINGLLNALGDTDNYLGSSACKALGSMGEKAATNEVINRLVNALGNKDRYLRSGACEALGKMGEKAVTNEVINEIVNALGDTDSKVRSRACEALGKMCEKAATNEVINRLVNALGNKDLYVRSRACEALGKMGENAATNEVINGLLNTLGNKDDHVRSKACEALSKMGEKAATSEVINGLLNALGDMDNYLRSSACKALGSIGEKVATNEVINGLLIALGDKIDNVRLSACEALSKIGEKSATSEVINGLVIALGDTFDRVRMKACEALGNIGEKIATNELIKVLLDAKYGDDSFVRYKVAEIIEKIFNILLCKSNLENNTVRKLSTNMNRLDTSFGSSISPEKFIETFRETEMSCWFLIIKKVFTRQGYCITIVKNTIVVYGRKEPVEISFFNKELGQKLRKYFDNWLKKSLQEREGTDDHVMIEVSAELEDAHN